MDLFNLNCPKLRCLERIAYSLFIFFWLSHVAFAGKLDVEGRDLNAQDMRLYGGLVNSGVLVVKATGNALAAGIQDGDVVVNINGQNVRGIFDMEEVLKSIRGMRFMVTVKRVLRQGLLRSQTLEFMIESAIDLQIQKAFTIDLGAESAVHAGAYQGRSILLWHANGVLTYNRTLDKEQISSLLKVYSIAEHQTYRYPVPEKVLETRFLTDNGLILYLSSVKEAVKMGIIDIETGERRQEWSLSLPPLNSKPYSMKLKDINGDKVPEIFYSFDNTITCIDGITGNVIWVRDELKTFFMDERRLEDGDYSDIIVEDFTRKGIQEVSAGPLLLNAATGEKVGYLSFDPVRYQSGILQCRQLVGDPIPDILTNNGLMDGNSAERIWEPLRSQQFFLADLNGDRQAEIIYLLGDKKIHVHDIDSHRELYSLELDGETDLDIQDFNRDGFSDILVRKGTLAYIYQTNIPVDSAVVSQDRGIGYAASLLDFGLRKDKFFVFARELFQKDQFAASIPLFLRALSETDDKKNPERYVEVVRYLASAFMKTGQVEGALGLLRQKEGTVARVVLKDFSSEIVSYLLDRNETWQAINFLELSKDEDPLLLSRCYLAVGRPEVAVKMLTEMQSKPTEAQLLLGKAYILMNQPIAARVALKNFLKYFPTSSDGWRELGLLEASESKWADAEEAFKVCLDLDAIQGHMALSAFYLLDSPKKDVASALKQARSAYKLEISTRTRMQLAEALIDGQDYREGQRILAQISDSGLEFNRFERLRQRCAYQIQAEDKYAEAEKLLVSPIFKNKNNLDAMALLNEIIERYPKSQSLPLAHYRLGEIYLDPDYRDEAKAIYHFAKVSKGDSVLKDKAQNNLKLLDAVKVSEEMNKEESNKNILKLETVPLRQNSSEIEALDSDSAPKRTEKSADEAMMLTPQKNEAAAKKNVPMDEQLKTIELAHPERNLPTPPHTKASDRRELEIIDDRRPIKDFTPQNPTSSRRELQQKENSSPLEGLRLDPNVRP